MEVLEAEKPKYLVGLRVLLGLAIIFILAFAAVALVVTLVAAVLFRKNSAYKAWRATCTASALAVGCFIAIFSPRFGVATISTYFMLRGSHSRFAQTVRAQFDSVSHRF